MHSIEQIIASVLSIVPAIALHEFGHAAMATKLGDPTPRLQGRLTLNPVAHFDPIGFLFVLMTAVVGFGIGWGKPVQVNPSYFEKHRQGLILVAVAGPLMNFCLACFTLAISYSLYMAGVPLSGFFQVLISTFLVINIGLILFNMLPIPPLDGGNVLINILPPKQSWALQRSAGVGLLIVMGLMWTGVLGMILGFFFSLVIQLVAAGFGMDFVAWLFGFSPA